MGQYKIHNPGFELISQRQGTLKEELLLHLYLYALGYKACFLNEWFLDSPEVLSLFHERWRKQEKVVWRNRDILFTQEDFNNPGMRELFEDLRSKNKPRKYMTELDRTWKMLESREKFKEYKRKLDSGLLDFL